MRILIKPTKANRRELTNTFIERVPSKPVTKTMKVFFVIIHATLFIDFGFIRGYKRINIINKTIVFTLATLFVIFCCIRVSALNLEGYKLAWRFKVILQHYSFIIILLFTRKIKFRDFLQKLHEVDAKIEIRADFYLDIQIIVYFILASATKAALVKLNWTHDNDIYMNNFDLEISFMIMHIASDVPLIVLFFIFHSIYVRLTMLRKFMKRKIFFDDKVIGDKTIIVYCHRVYVALVDLTESIKKTYDYIFLISLVMNVPSILAVIYSAIKDIKSNSNNAFFTVEFFMVVHIMCMKFAPAIAAGSLSIAADKIKVLLHNRLIDEKDVEKAGALLRFVRYADARPCRLRVLALLPLDASLPARVADLCCTYVIVLVQLTHLY